MFLGIFENTNSVTLCQNSVFFAKFWGCQNEVFEKKIAFFVFVFLCWRNRNRKKKTNKMEKAKKPYKNRFFWSLSSKNVKIKNGFLAKIAWHYLCQEGRKSAHFSCTLSVLAIFFFLSQYSVNQENYKNSGFSGNCSKPKMTPFLWKRCFFDMGEKVGFTNCVFKSCVLLKTLFL